MPSSVMESNIMESCVYEGKVVHKRMHPFGHKFAYRVWTGVFNLDDLPGLGLRLFGFNRPALFSFHEKDHGARDGSPLRPWVEKIAAEAGLDVAGGKIFIQCLPRILGYVFNPLSIYFIHDRDDRLVAVLYEVKNTFGDQHAYFIPVTRVENGYIQQKTVKKLHVSPFFPVSGGYRFRVRVPDEAYRVTIRYLETLDSEALIAVQTGKKTGLNDRNLIGLFFRYPLLNLKIIGGIHFEAIRLFLKKARFHRRPSPPPPYSL